MASWWTSADMPDSLDPEDNSIVSRVLQAVGLFGDILSLEDTMEPMLSEVRGRKSPDSDEAMDEDETVNEGEDQESEDWREEEEKEQEDLQGGEKDGRIDMEKETEVDRGVSDRRRADGAGDTVLTDGEGGSVAARDQSEDIYPTSPSSDKEPDDSSLSSTDAPAPTVTHTHLASARVRLRLTDPSEEDASGETPPERHTDPGCRLENRATLMDADAQLMVSTQGNKEPGPTQNLPSTESPVMEAKEDKGDKEEGGQNCPEMNGEEDKKNDSQQPSKYKTVSYRRIRRGNTKQRIDEFEAMINL
ncbi:ermin [Seriola lalandi dorsalis]|uniref:ermin n=1 Tax=Seriola lalandi dorsalis TaxID=1841481 RepID=UPI000C6FA1ED|nr:ermin [Seriola lalandi dorsalis]